MSSGRKQAHIIKKLKLHSWRYRLKLPLGIVLIALSLALFAFPSVYKKYTDPPIKVDASEPIRIDKKLLEGKATSSPPARIIIPSLSIDLPIVEAQVVSGYWQLSETTASHGVGSANPGDSGNTVIFAHAREGLFLPLRQIKKDGTVYILTHDRWFQYKVENTKEVNPNQVEVIAPTPDETLTLYTCSGFLDSKRLIVTAKPQPR